MMINVKIQFLKLPSLNENSENVKKIENILRLSFYQMDCSTFHEDVNTFFVGNNEIKFNLY